MRVLFTAYAINAAWVCLALTVALMVMDEHSAAFDRFLGWTAEYMFLCFGPVLLLLAIVGVTQLPLNKDCSLDVFVQQITCIDIFLVFVFVVISAGITFSYALLKTEQYAKDSLMSEHSVFFRVFSHQLK